MVIVAYLDDERSASDGAPVELYEFTGAVATYRYTSGPASVVYGGNMYTPAAGLERGGISHGTDNASAGLEVRIASSSPLAQAYAVATPPTSLRLRIYRLQAVSGEAVTVWHADAVSISVRGAIATIRTSSLVGQALETQVPAAVVQTMCGHRLYSLQCGVDRAAYSHATTVTEIDASGHLVTLDGLASYSYPDDWFRGGEFERTSDGQRRTIVVQSPAANRNVIRLFAPLGQLSVGDAVTLWPGCNHVHHVRPIREWPRVEIVGHCQNRFDNVVNYGGHPFVPVSSPFATPLVQVRRS